MTKTPILSLQQVTRIALLSALCVVLRYAFASLPNVQPITAIFLLWGLLVSLRESLLIMAVTMLVSSFLLGFGPWVFWQILAFALVLLLWRWLLCPLSKFLATLGISELLSQSVFAGLMSVAYGVIIDSCYALLYGMPWWTYVLAGASFNLAHALSTLLFYPLLFPIIRRFSHEKNT